MAKRKKSSNEKEIKVSPIVVIIIAVIVVLFTVIYFVSEPFRAQVNSFFDTIFSENELEVKENEPKGDSELRVHFLNVGQGDSIFLELPDDTVMLIDAGDRNNATAEFIITYIQSFGYTTIDYLMLTHSDSDHVGNMSKIVDAFEIEKAFIPEFSAELIGTQVYSNFLQDIKAEEGCVIEYLYIFDNILSIDETNEFYISCLWPTKDFYNGLKDESSLTSHEKNDISPILLLEYQQKRMVFTGDANAEVEQTVVSNFNNSLYNNAFTGGDGYYGIDLRDIDILKVGHHGSDGSSCEEFVELLSPEFSVISSGGEYGHPHEATLVTLDKHGSEILRTDLVGTIVATVYPDATKDINILIEVMPEDGNNNLATITVISVGTIGVSSGIVAVVVSKKKKK